MFHTIQTKICILVLIYETSSVPHKIMYIYFIYFVNIVMFKHIFFAETMHSNNVISYLCSSHRQVSDYVT